MREMLCVVEMSDRHSHSPEIAKHQLLHSRLEEALRSDKKLQALYLTVTHIFVDQLRIDLDLLAKHKDFIGGTEEDR